MLVTSAPILFLLHLQLKAPTLPCNYNAGVQWTELPIGVHVMPCSTTTPMNPFQQWAGDTLTSNTMVASSITNAGTPGYCLGEAQEDPVTMTACKGSSGSDGTATKFMYNHTARTLGVAGNSNKCLNINHDTGPDVNFNRCPRAGITPPRVQARRQYDWLPLTSQLRSVFEPMLCLTLNRSKILTFIQPPCVWPSVPPPQPPWNGPSALLKGITILENVTAIPGYGADTWYPAEDRYDAIHPTIDLFQYYFIMVSTVSIFSIC